MITRGTALAIVGGALIGAIAGLMTHGAGVDRSVVHPDFQPISVGSLASVPPASVASAVAVTAPSALPSSATPPSEPLPVAPTAVVTLPDVNMAAGEADEASDNAGTAAVFPSWAPLAAAPTNKAELTRLLEACGQRDGRACLASGIAYEKGLGTPPNRSEAERFKRIALSYLARFCERRDAGACIVLAGMYRRGLIVAESATQAESLEQRAAELCRAHTAPACADLKTP